MQSFNNHADRYKAHQAEIRNFYEGSDQGQSFDKKLRKIQLDLDVVNVKMPNTAHNTAYELRVDSRNFKLAEPFKRLLRDGEDFNPEDAGKLSHFSDLLNKTKTYLLAVKAIREESNKNSAPQKPSRISFFDGDPVVTHADAAIAQIDTWLDSKMPEKVDAFANPLARETRAQDEAWKKHLKPNDGTPDSSAIGFKR